MNTSDQVIIRPMRFSDVYAIGLWGEKHPEIWLSAYHYKEHRNREKMTFLRICKWYFKRRIPGLRWLYAIEGVDGALYGYWTIEKKHPLEKRAYLGVAMNPSEVNRGVGTISMQKIIRIGFIELGLTEVWNSVLAVNKRSISLTRRCGLVQYDSKMEPHDDQSMRERLIAEYPEYFSQEDGVLMTRVCYHRLERSRYLEMLKER